MSKIRGFSNQVLTQTYLFDLTSLPTTSTYPIVFGADYSRGKFIDVAVESFGTASGSADYNSSSFKGSMVFGGFNDVPSTINGEYFTYSNTKRKIVVAYYGTQSTCGAIYVRGGFKYVVYSDALDVICTGGEVTIGTSIFKVGDTNGITSGGANFALLQEFQASGLVSSTTFYGIPTASVTDVISKFAPIPLASGWSSYNSSYNDLSFYITNQRVHLTGVVKSNSSLTVIATLPKVIAPYKREIFSATCNKASVDSATRLDVDNLGNIIVPSATYGWVSLSGVSWRPNSFYRS